MINFENALKSLTATVPKLRTPLQLSGLVIVAAVFALPELLTQVSPATQICAGAIGVCMIVFGQVFAYLNQIPEDRRDRLILFLFTIFCILMLCLIAATAFSSKFSATLSIKRLLREADTAYERKDFSTALGKYQTVANLSQNDLSARYGIAKCYVRKNDRPSAMRAISEALICPYETTSESFVARANLLNLRGIMKKNTGEYYSALNDFKQAVGVIKNISSNESTRALAAIYGNIADSYDYLGNHKEALTNSLTAISLDKEAGWEQGELEDSINTAGYYRALGNYKLAAEMLDSCMVIAQRLSDQDSQAHIYWQKASLMVEHDSNRAEDTKEYYERALACLDDQSDRRLRARIYGDYGQLLIDHSLDFVAGKAKLMIALSVNVEMKDKTGIGAQLSSMHDAFAALGEIPAAHLCGAITELCFQETSSSEVKEWLDKFRAFERDHGLDKVEVRTSALNDRIEALSRYTGLSHIDSRTVFELCASF